MPAPARDAYLDLLAEGLTRYHSAGLERGGGRRHRGAALVLWALRRRGYTIVPALPSVDAVRAVPRLPGSPLLARLLARRGLAITEDGWPAPPSAPAPGGWRGLDVRLARLEREHGLDWPAHAETMSGLRRLANLRDCAETALADGVPGDLVEAGVWRGGSAIFMRGVLAAHGESSRQVWLADSFSGLPAPDAGRYPSDQGIDYTGFGELAVGLEQVRGNFARFRLLDDRVRFLPGWFAETLPDAPIEQIAVLRLDGDLYASTIDALEALYPRLAPGGFCIVDDYGALETCRRAVTDFRDRHAISEPILPAGDWTGAYWRRAAAA